jgi:GTPase SAR1 family protein
MANPIIIGITGKKGVGKSTVSDYITNKYEFAEAAFADTLKCACMEIFKLNSRQLFGTQADKERIDDYWKVSPRKIMQEVGHAIREIGTNVPELNRIWIRSLHKEIELRKLHKVVISDVRYPDEAESINEYYKKGWDVCIIKITRDLPDVDNHESETQEIKADYIINNNGTRSDLFNAIDDIIMEFD